VLVTALPAYTVIGLYDTLYVASNYSVVPINSLLLTVRTTLVYSDTKYSAPFMSFLPSTIVFHYLFIRLAFGVFVSFVPLVIYLFTYLFIQFFIHSFIHSSFPSFFPSLGLSFYAW